MSRTGPRRSAITWLRRLALILLLPTVLAACASVPPQTVELSNTLGRDLAELERAHRELASLYFRQAKDDVNRFIDEVYTPAFIKEFAKQAKLDTAVTKTMDEKPEDLLEGLTAFVNKAHERIEKKRRELLDPIEKQEADVMDAIIESHRRVQAGHGTIAAYLASVVKVRETQNQLLAEVGLEGLPEEVGRQTAAVADKIAELTALGQDTSAGIDAFDAKIRDIKDALSR